MKNNLYFGYQMNMKDTKQSVLDAIQRYYEKFGLPPQILEVSDKLEANLLPETNLVVRKFRMPVNILLIGDNDETQVQMDMASE